MIEKLIFGFWLVILPAAPAPDCTTTITGHADSDLISSYSCGRIPTMADVLKIDDGDTLIMVQDLHIKDLELGLNSTIHTNGFTIFKGL